MELSRRTLVQGAGVTAIAAWAGINTSARPAAAMLPPASPPILHPGSVGITQLDVSPTASSLSGFSSTSWFCLDDSFASVGLEHLGASHSVDALELRTDFGMHNLNPRDLTVYSSSDNSSWAKVAAFDFWTSVIPSGCTTSESWPDM